MSELILVVEDEELARKNMAHILKKEGYEVTTADSGVKAIHLLESTEFDLVITDLKMKQVDGLEILKKTKSVQPLTEVIMITGYATVDSAVTALKDGAYHYIAKPCKNDEVRRITREALLKRQLQLENIELKDTLKKERKSSAAIIGKSPAISRVKKTIAQIAPTDVNVLILGESGTGKELAAKALHEGSARSGHKMVAFNCGAFSEELLANELFGHEKGAYTGANAVKEGLIETADKGTVFLDEIGDMPVSMQINLLRVIQEKEMMRVGGMQPIPVDVRFIAATHRDLNREVSKRRFRQDLFYRLNVVSIELPPLTEREGDIPLLAYHFLALKTKEMNREIREISREALDLLCRYSWPGNVRELENIIERAVALERDTVIHPASLPEYITTMAIETYRYSSSNKIPSLEEQEKNYIKWVLDQCGWNKTKAAKIMGIDRVSLWRKINRYNLGQE
ncbi:MAG: sigma-54 dependent transcriptional regulator [Desulfarculaceae bacterium]|nr:sigma-54 dependent transcriptional regulator [Desulfarculaceae bacterium]